MSAIETQPDTESAEGITASAKALFGEVPDAAVSVLHVLAVSQRQGQDARVLRITPSTPKCAWDFFALQLARARADAIIISGKILRDEPELTYGVGESSRAFLEFRHNVLKLPLPPRLVVLTRDPALPLEHPIFDGPWPVTIATSETSARALEPRLKSTRAAGPQPSLWAEPAPALPTLIARLHKTLGPECTVSLECGPNTVAPLYEAQRPCVDEIMLSEFEGEVAPELLTARPWRVPPEHRGYHTLGEPRSVHTEHGAWTFRRLRRS